MDKDYLSCFVIGFALLFSGCASTTAKPVSYAIGQAARVFKVSEFSVFEVPSRGAISDTMAIAAGGGANASSLQQMLVSLAKSKNGKILLFSQNADLSAAVVKGALDGKNYKGVWLVYAGSASQSEVLKSLVQQASMRYDFINMME